MNKTKIMITAFAVFASFLMLMTPTFAGPVSDATIMETVESAQNELADSIDALYSKLIDDNYLNSLTEQLSNDRELNRITSNIDNTEDVTAKVSLANSYVTALENKQAFIDLQTYIKNTYASDLRSINTNYNEFADILASYQSTYPETTDEELLVAFENPFGSPFQNDDDNTGVETGSKGTLLTCDGGIVSSTTTTGDGPVYGEIDLNTEAQWVSFPRNMDGDILTPDGWVSPDDPNYDDWLQIEDILQNSGLSPVDVYAILFIISAFVLLVDYIAIMLYAALGATSPQLVLFLILVFYLSGISTIFSFYANVTYYDRNPP